MQTSIRLTSALVALMKLCLGLPSGPLHAAEPDIIVGSFTAVQGQVQMMRPGAAQPVSVKLSDAVFYKATIETQESSQAKALFLDDSMLAMAEHSTVQVNEQAYDPKRGKRSLVFNLLEGKVRALVTKVFPSPGSRFEIHTSSAVASARGAYFVMWIERGAGAHETPNGITNQTLLAPGEAGTPPLPNREFTGIANIGDAGSVDFTSEGQTVMVKPGHFAIAVTGQPPSAPVPLAKGIPMQVSQAIRATSVVNAPKSETPYEMLRAMANGTQAMSSMTPGIIKP